jgi:DNA-binding HxlR family transcriptional regulator
LLIATKVPEKEHRMKRERAAVRCPIERSVGQIGDSWTFMILRDAMYGVHRFTDFKNHIGIATNVLSARLSSMVDDGILEIREGTAGNSHEYHLTQKGRDLHVVLAALRQWGQKYLFEDGEMMNCAVDSATGEPPAELRLTSKDGRLLGVDDLDIVVTKVGSDHREPFQS